MNITEFANAMTMKGVDFSEIDYSQKHQWSPLIAGIDNLLQETRDELMFPELRTFGNNAISVYSDYGGESPDSKYSSYSFLFGGWNHNFGVQKEFLEMRKKYKLGEKEIAFKDLKYGPIQRCLDDYLTISNNFVFGLLLTVIIEKDIRGLFVNLDSDEGMRMLAAEGFTEWKTPIAEKMLRILHIISYFAPLISKDNQRLFWMTDNDSIVANKKMMDAIPNLLQRIMIIYSQRKYEMLGYATPFNEFSALTSDQLSLTDLVAGAIEQYFTRKYDSENVEMKAGAEKILQWLAHQGVGLKKMTLLITRESDLIYTHRVNFNDLKPNSNATIIPVLTKKLPNHK